MEERYFALSTPDDGVPTSTSVEQENAEDACKDSLYDYTDDRGRIDRETCAMPKGFLPPFCMDPCCVGV